MVYSTNQLIKSTSQFKSTVYSTFHQLHKSTSDENTTSKLIMSTELHNSTHQFSSNMGHILSLHHLCLLSTWLTVFILRGRGTGISNTPAGAPLVSSLACLGESSPCWLGVCTSANCTFGDASSSVGCFWGVSVVVDAWIFGAKSDNCGLGGKSFSWGLGGRSDNWGLGGNSDSCGFGGRSESWGFGGSSSMCGLGGISAGWGLSAACGILGGGSVGLVMVSLVGMSTTWVGFCRTSGPWLGFSTWVTIPGVFLNATEKKEGQHILSLKVYQEVKVIEPVI